MYAISDLHLSLTDRLDRRKSMNRFGEVWVDHHIRLEKHWKETVTDDDTVIIAGDISWAERMDDFLADGRFIDTLPGQKILTRGNHDYFWQSNRKVTEAFPRFIPLKNDCMMYNVGGREVYLASVKGSVCPNDYWFGPEDERLYRKETNRLKDVLKKCTAKGAEEIILIMHFPPFNDKREQSLYLDLIQSYPVKTVIYGHLHGTSHETGIKGQYMGTEYILVSGDYVDFKPVLII